MGDGIAYRQFVCRRLGDVEADEDRVGGNDRNDGQSRVFETGDVLRIGDDDGVGCPGLDLDELNARLGDDLDLDGVEQGGATPVVLVPDVPDQTPRHVRVKLERTGPNRRVAVAIAQLFVGGWTDLGRVHCDNPR